MNRIRDSAKPLFGASQDRLQPKLEFDLSDNYPRLEYEEHLNTSPEYQLYEKLVHRGQRKLFMSEFQHLIHCLDHKNEVALVVYIGSSPNNKALRHLRYFPNVKYIFIDPNMCNIITDRGQSHYFKQTPDKSQAKVVYLKYSSNADATLAGRRAREKGIQFFNGSEVVIIPDKFVNQQSVSPGDDETIRFITGSDHRIYIIEDYFSSDTAVFIRKLFDQVACKKILWSDMRSTNDSTGIMIDHVRIYNWSRVVLPDFAMFKFRCPFDLNIDYDSYREEYDEAASRGLDMTNIGTVMPYFAGRIMTQTWQKRNSTESRLWVAGDDIRNNKIVNYDLRVYEEQFCYYNELQRACAPHVNYYFNPKTGLGRCGDCAIEGRIWDDYRKKFDTELDVSAQVRDLSKLTDTRNMIPLTNPAHFPM